jgi:FMN-dependent oxidoreductase (nitrilotriacetate monooxygenase family)
MSQMRLGLFQLASVQIGGTLSWPHPRSESLRFHEPEYWIEMAQIIDTAGFDFLFFADSLGYPLYQGDLHPAAAAAGLHFPTLDPLILIPSIARATQRLGFVATSTTGLDHPVLTARRLATLDHVTQGRLGWNVVTGGAQSSMAALFGHESMREHDDRYALAAEYLDVFLKYTEGCWEPTAVTADRTRQVYAERNRLHRIEHQGDHYRSSGYLTVDPSPQRTPVLFQAGASPAGRDLSSRYAEAVFVAATTPEQVAAHVADIRERAAFAGRDPDAVVIMGGASVTVADSTDRALTLRAEFDALQSDEIVNILYAGNTGIDLMSLDADRPLSQVLESGKPIGQLGQTHIQRFMPTNPDEAPTVKQIISELRGRGVRGFEIVGDPTEVADEMERLLEVTGLNGFIIEPLFDLADVRDFVHLVVPELQRRGCFPRTPRTGTLRAQMFGSDHLPRSHPGANYRVWES